MLPDLAIWMDATLEARRMIEAHWMRERLGEESSTSSTAAGESPRSPIPRAPPPANQKPADTHRSHGYLLGDGRIGYFNDHKVQVVCNHVETRRHCPQKDVSERIVVSLGLSCPELDLERTKGHQQLSRLRITERHGTHLCKEGRHEHRKFISRII